MSARSRAIRFIVSLGIVSLFADITYEGARSLSGPFLATLGASATSVGIVAGAGELIGYGLRYVSGAIADRSRRYWTIVFAGYGMNLVAVPLLALAGSWPVAAGLLMLERFGKSIRAPARDALLSHAAVHTGVGWGFGLHEAMDQVGALTGPLLMAWMLGSYASYPAAFAILAIPAACALVSLALGRMAYPPPSDIQPVTRNLEAGLPRPFWHYTIAAGLLSFGYVDFALLAFHFKKTAVAADAWLPVFYSAAMAVDLMAAPALGWWFDRQPRRALAAGMLAGIPAAPLALLGGMPGAVAGVLFWGAGMGARESVLRATVARLVPAEKRASAYGVFHGVNGVLWFLGSALFGALYDVSLTALAAVSVIVQASALILFNNWRDPSTIAV